MLWRALPRFWAGARRDRKGALSSLRDRLLSQVRKVKNRQKSSRLRAADPLPAPSPSRQQYTDPARRPVFIFQGAPRGACATERGYCRPLTTQPSPARAKVKVTRAELRRGFPALTSMTWPKVQVALAVFGLGKLMLGQSRVISRDL